MGSPMFPYTARPSGRVVVDEWCHCGCKRTNHKGEKFTARCRSEGCGCVKFKWRASIFDDPLQRLKGKP